MEVPLRAFDWAIPHRFRDFQAGMTFANHHDFRPCCLGDERLSSSSVRVLDIN
jgi:hypothetical protein